MTRGREEGVNKKTRRAGAGEEWSRNTFAVAALQGGFAAAHCIAADHRVLACAVVSARGGAAALCIAVALGVGAADAVAEAHDIAAAQAIAAAQGWVPQLVASLVERIAAGSPQDTWSLQPVHSP